MGTTDRPALPIATRDSQSSASSQTRPHPDSTQGSAAGGPERKPTGGNQQLGDVLERVSDAVVALDREWRYTYVNQRAAELFGRKPEDLLGHHIWTEFPQGLGQPFHLAYEKAMAEQVFVEIENCYEPWDRWFENRIYPSPDGVSIFFHEITDRKRAERAARDNAALLEGQNRVLEDIARGEPIEHTLDLLLRFVEAQCPEMLCSILLPDAGGPHIRHGAAPRLPATFTGAIQGDAAGRHPSAFARAAFRPEVVIVDDIATDRLWDDCRDVALEHGLRASWSSPVLDPHGSVLGTFAVYSRNPSRPSERHRSLISLATHTAATALMNQRETDARRASEERLRLAVDGANIGIWEWDVVRDRFVLSQQLKAMFDWRIPADDLTLKEIIGRIHREDRPHIEQAMQHSVEWGVDFDVEYRVVAPGGSIRWIATKGGGEYDESSTPVRMLGIALDITKRKETEIQLRRSEERFQLVARATNDAIWDWDLVTDAVWWNQGVTTLFGYSANDVRRDAGWRAERIHPDDVEAVLSGVRSAAAAGRQFWSGEFRFRRQDGSYANVFDRGFLIYDAHAKPVRMIGAMADITDRKRDLELLEEAVAFRTAQLASKNQQLVAEISERKRVAELLRNRNEELKAFAYTVSHDLKAPLRGIVGYVQELSRRQSACLDERARFSLDRILSATRNLDRLIGDLLHYSRLDAETATPIDVDLNQVLERILRDRRPMILEQHADITIGLDVTRIHVWERGLAQVLSNLIDNALKFSRRATPPRIEVRSRLVAGGVRLSVSDNGIGFDMRHHDRIFELFNRLVRQEDFDGTGAGLAIVKKVVEKMRGKVWAEASPGSGATFFVDLPVRAG